MILTITVNLHRRVLKSSITPYQQACLVGMFGVTSSVSDLCTDYS